MIMAVKETNLKNAAEIRSITWQESHKQICSPVFIATHTTEQQAGYLRQELQYGKKLYMLTDEIPKGIVSVYDNLIENLYVLPSEQRKGYGTKLLQHAVNHCQGTPTLWVLSSNKQACQCYRKFGFGATGRTRPLSEGLWEQEMAYMP